MYHRLITIRNTNFYLLMRKFTYYIENYSEKLKKRGACKVDLWAHENKVISINPCLQDITPFISFSLD